MTKHTGHLQQPVSQSAFSMVNMSNDAKVPDSFHRELGQVNRILKKTQEEKPAGDWDSHLTTEHLRQINHYLYV